MKKAPSNNQLMTTKKVYDLRQDFSINTLQEMTGISKKGIYNKLKSSQWSKAEVFFINHLHAKHYGV